MRDRITRWLAVLLLAGATSPACPAADYWVAPGGRDDRAGGSVTTPWATLQYAADRVRPGDTVTVRPGRYVGFYLETSGTAARPITFRALPGAVIERRNPKTPDGINLEGAGHIAIEGFRVVGMPRAGVRATHGDRVTIRGVHADRNRVWGIFTSFCNDLAILDNITSRSGKQHGIYVSNSGDRPVIRGNQVWGNYGAGIHMNGDASQGGDGIISGALVVGNTIYDNGRGGASAINADGVQDSRFQNNLLYNNHSSGISLYRIDGAAGSTNNVVVNNTVVVAADGRWALNIKNDSTGNAAFNNILYNANPAHGSINITSDSLPGFHSDYNAVIDRFSSNDGETRINLAQWRSATGQDRHSLVATPGALFVNASRDDFHLSAASPAVDAGTSQQAPQTDREGNARPSGRGHDIGAYERGAADAGGRRAAPG